MRNIMSLKLLVVNLGLILLLAGTVQADYVDSVVLIPDADGLYNTFDSTRNCTDHYDCVNDSCTDANRCDTDTSAKLYGSSGWEQYGLTQASPTDTLNLCDSMAIYANFAEQRDGTSGEWKVAWGWRFKEFGAWDWCSGQGGSDTLTIDGSTCTVYRISWTKNPYWGDPRGIPWYWYAGYLDDEEASNAFQPAFIIISAESGCFLTDCIVTMFDVWVVFYLTVTEAEGNPRLHRKKRMGGIDEEDYHNPRHCWFVLDW